MTVIRRVCCVVQFVCAFLKFSIAYRAWMTSDELEDHINPGDLKQFLRLYEVATNRGLLKGGIEKNETENETDCFGIGPTLRTVISLLDTDDDVEINTHFYFSSRDKPLRVQVFPGDQFSLETVDFQPTRRTVMIVHGFMSHSNASWVHDMAEAFLKWGDVNVIAVDWSGGGNTWKYWQAVANTRLVGHDIMRFLQQLKDIAGADLKNFHLVGHSLGAHICSFASHFVGGVSRITGLDPAQPCFRTANISERLDPSDADFVDVIHTNARHTTKIGFGWPEPTGHADFYPNGGMKQPGCGKEYFSVMYSRLQQSICAHGRSYFLFTESLVNVNCSFEAHRWDLTYDGVNDSLVAPCDWDNATCSEMGIDAVGDESHPRAAGTYFLVTTDKEPFCPTESQLPEAHLLGDLRDGFRLMDGTEDPTTEAPGKWWEFWKRLQYLQLVRSNESPGIETKCALA